jgi:hypothetical protein
MNSGKTYKQNNTVKSLSEFALNLFYELRDSLKARFTKTISAKARIVKKEDIGEGKPE